MTNITIQKNAKGWYKGFSCNGHSGFSYEGMDIVCAAISSAAYLTANTVTEVIHADAIAEAEDGLKVLHGKSSLLSQTDDILPGRIHVDDRHGVHVILLFRPEYRIHYETMISYFPLFVIHFFLFQSINFINKFI